MEEGNTAQTAGLIKKKRKINVDIKRLQRIVREKSKTINTIKFRDHEGLYILLEKDHYSLGDVTARGEIGCRHLFKQKIMIGECLIKKRKRRKGTMANVTPGHAVATNNSMASQNGFDYTSAQLGLAWSYDNACNSHT